MKKLFAFLICGISVGVHAGMPYITNNTAETFERVTSGDVTCESRKAHSTLNAGYYQSNEGYYGNQLSNDDKGVFVAISVPLTSRSTRVDCQSLYNTALAKEQLKVKQLEAQVEMQAKMLKSRTLVAE